MLKLRRVKIYQIAGVITPVLALGLIFNRGKLISSLESNDVVSMQGEELAAFEGGRIVETSAGNVSLDLKNADIATVLGVLAYKGGVNIVTTEDIEGRITLRLANVPWDEAFRSVLRTRNYTYEREGSIVTVASLEALMERSQMNAQLYSIQPLVTEIFTLKFIDAGDARDVIEPQLSSRGTVGILKGRSRRGWSFTASNSSAQGSGSLAKDMATEKAPARAKMLVVSDIPPYMERIRKVVERLDVMPKQVLIEAKIIEVNKDKLQDLGFDWGTGSGGAESSTVNGVPADKHLGDVTQTVGANILSSQEATSIFDPKTSGISGAFPFDSGLAIVYKKLTGTQFEAILHALEEDIDANTLSSPRVLTLDNQEATILIGTKFPILESNVSGTEATTTTSTLSYYQDIGIQLSVIPQISGGGHINMIVHPAVTSFTETLAAKGSSGQTIAEYPILQTREIETQIVMKDGETIVIGGLLKDVKSEGVQKVPFLGDIPILGWLFQRKTVDTEKIELMIFISAKIIDEHKLSNNELLWLKKYEVADKE